MLDGASEDARQVLAKIFYDLFDHQFAGGIVVNRDGRVIWISRGYADLLGLMNTNQALGQPVERLIPNSRLREVMDSGDAIPLDFMVHRDKTFVAMRLPIRDESGHINGAAGVLVYESWLALKPLVEKFAHLQTRVSEARQATTRHRQTRYTLADIVGNSPACFRMKKLARRAADLDTTILLLGETGTGKELLAQAIHADSLRTNKPFVAINVAAIPETLLESEFFGSVAGAYTGADKRGREGKFKLADGGTLFLDEIGDMTLALQAKLLRVLQEQEIEPLGSNQLIKVDVRVIAATSRNLTKMVADGLFRADLYYRLNVLPIALPPLRERREDITLLAEKMLVDIGRRCGYPKRGLSAAAQAWLAAQAWPGNIRELRNVLEQASMLSERSQLDVADFTEASTTVANEGIVRPLATIIAEAERNALVAALAATSGNKTEAAKLLQIGRATFYEKLATHGLA